MLQKDMGQQSVSHSGEKIQLIQMFPERSYILGINACLMSVHFTHFPLIFLMQFCACSVAILATDGFKKVIRDFW